MEINLRWWILALCNLLLFWLQGMVGDATGALGLTLSVNALYVIMPAVCLSQGWGLVLMFLAGLSVDAGLPIGFGFHAVMFAVALTVLHAYQRSLQKAGLGQLIALTIGLNIIFQLVEAVLLAGPLSSYGEYWLRIGSDLVASTLATGLVGWWFLSLEHWLLTITGQEMAEPENV